MNFRAGEFAIGLVVGIGIAIIVLLGGSTLLDVGLMADADGPADWLGAVAGIGAMLASVVGVFFLNANLKAANAGVKAALDANHLQSEEARAWVTVEIVRGSYSSGHINTGNVVRIKNVGVKPALNVSVSAKLIGAHGFSEERLQKVVKILAARDMQPQRRILMLPSGQENDLDYLVGEPRPGKEGKYSELLVVVSYRSLADAEAKITAQVFKVPGGLRGMMDTPFYVRTEHGYVT